MLTYIGLSELNISSGISKSSDYKQADDVFSLAFNFTSDVCFEKLKDHTLVDTILNIASNPDRIS